MILSCPACEARFKIPDDEVWEDGRDVRCSDCGHIWHAEKDDDLSYEYGDSDIDEDFAEEESDSLEAENVSEDEDDGDDLSVDYNESEDEADEASNEIEDEIEPPQTEEEIADLISKGVEAAQEESKSSDKKKNTKKKKKPKDKIEKTPEQKRKIIHGYTAAAAILVWIFIALIAGYGPITKSVPFTQGFYSVFGLIPVETKAGQNLVFDRPKVEREKNTLKITGRIINLGGETQAVPNIAVDINNADDEALLAQYLIPAPIESIEGEKTIPFLVRTDDIPPLLDKVLQETGDISAHIKFMINPDIKGRTVIPLP